MYLIPCSSALSPVVGCHVHRCIHSSQAEKNICCMKIKASFLRHLITSYANTSFCKNLRYLIFNQIWLVHFAFAKIRLLNSYITYFVLESWNQYPTLVWDSQTHCLVRFRWLLSGCFRQRKKIINQIFPKILPSAWFYYSNVWIPPFPTWRLRTEKPSRTKYPYNEKHILRKQ